MWRKNRQPNAGSTAVGTDLNRNWAWQWGCCGGSSGTFSSETYRGTAPFSAPETTVVRDFVNSRVVDGVQQIKTGIDFHTYSELVLWPYGYTTANTAAGPDRRRRGDVPDAGHQHRLHERLHARAGQRPVHRRRHDRRLAVGPAQDLRLHVRDVPEDVEPGLLSARRGDRRRRRRATARRCCGCWRSPTARTARSARRRSTAAWPSPTVFSDDFEAARGWTASTTGATTGRFERGDPAATNSGGDQAARHDGRAASTTSSPAAWRAPRRATTTSTAASPRSPRRPITLAAGATLHAELLVLHGARQQLVVGRLPAGADRRHDRVPGARRGEQRQRAPGRRRA